MTTLNIILIVLTAIALFIMSLLLGFDIERKRLTRELKHFKHEDVDRYMKGENSLHNGIWQLFLWVFIMSLCWAISTATDSRDKVIDRYKEGKIIERVTYRYEKVDGVKILKDSTVTYIRLKE